MRRTARLSASLLVVLACAGCDQVAKRVAEETLSQTGPVSYLDGLIQFRLVTNQGAFLSLGADLPEAIRTPLFSFGVPALLGALLIWQLVAHSLPRLQALGLALVLGGGAGNVIDRLTNHGAVVDFVSIGVGPLRTGIFNVADVAIMAGALLAMWSFRAHDTATR